MGDRLRGTVPEVLDGDTLALVPDWVGPTNKHHYPRRALVRLRGGDAPEKGEPGYQEARDALATVVLGKRVEAEVATYRPDERRDIVRVFLLDGHGGRGPEVKVAVDKPRRRKEPEPEGSLVGALVAAGIIVGTAGAVCWVMDRWLGVRREEGGEGR